MTRIELTFVGGEHEPRIEYNAPGVPRHGDHIVYQDVAYVVAQVIWHVTPTGLVVEVQLTKLDEGTPLATVAAFRATLAELDRYKAREASALATAAQLQGNLDQLQSDLDENAMCTCYGQAKCRVHEVAREYDDLQEQCARGGLADYEEYQILDKMGDLWWKMSPGARKARKRYRKLGRG